jgi:hypothetical protein
MVMPVKEEAKFEPWKDTNSVSKQRTKERKTSLSPASILDNF